MQVQTLIFGSQHDGAMQCKALRIECKQHVSAAELHLVPLVLCHVVH